jgi:hypothetical protein
MSRTSQRNEPMVDIYSGKYILLNSSVTRYQVPLYCPFANEIPSVAQSVSKVSGVSSFTEEIIATLPACAIQYSAGKAPGYCETIQDNNSLTKSFQQDLSFDRLNVIRKHLWMCGQSMNTRSLYV